MWQTYMSPMKRLGQTSSAWLPNLFPPYNTFTRSFTVGVEGTVRSCRLFIVDYENIYTSLQNKMQLWNYLFVYLLLSTFIPKVCWGFTIAMLVLTRTGVPGLKLNQWPIFSVLVSLTPLNLFGVHFMCNFYFSFCGPRLKKDLIFSLKIVTL